MRSRFSFTVLRRVAFLSLLVACGSRTGLFDEGESFNVIPNNDGGPTGRGTGEGGLDREDGGLDDGAIPPIDARPPTDVFRDDCPDAEALLVYTINSNRELQSFNPATGQFKTVATLSCPGVEVDEGPFSMAVDRRGVAYVLFENERLYRVSTATGSCIATSYVPRQSNFKMFGMGFATDRGGPSESLFISGDETQNDGADGLARIDPLTFQLTPLAGYDPPITRAELTGTGDGRLFGFYRKREFDEDSYIGEINTVGSPGNPVGKIIGERFFPEVDQGQGWAFAFWGGDFYMFHAPQDQARVTRWRPSDDTVVQVATPPVRIVGAGVSTCAPQQ